MSGNLDPSDYGGTDPYGFDPNASGNNGSGLHVDGAGTITDDLAGGRAVGVTAPGTNPDTLSVDSSGVIRDAAGNVVGQTDANGGGGDVNGGGTDGGGR